MGVVDISKAISMARESGLDLVEISPNATPPVCKILDWGKYNYHKTKQIQKNKKNQKSSDLKQVRLGLKIGENDLDIKVRKIEEFLEAGHKVRVSAFFRGRELAHKEIGHQLLDKVVNKLQELAIVEQEPSFAGKQLSMVIRGSNNAKAKNA